MRPRLPSTPAASLAWAWGVLAAGALALLAAPASAATNRTIVLNATSVTVPFQTTVAITGHLTGEHVGGQQVSLSRDPYPFNARYEPVASVRTAPDGVFTFTRRPGQSTAFRVRAGSTHADLVVRVRYAIAMSVATGSPRRGQSVRFSGSVAPGVAGHVVRLQRKTPAGSWATVKTTTLVVTESTEPCPSTGNQPSDTTGQTPENPTGQAGLPTPPPPTIPAATSTQTPTDPGTQAPSDTGNQAPSDDGSQRCRQRNGTRTSPATADKTSWSITTPVFYSGYYRALVYSDGDYVTSWGPVRRLTVIARPR